MVNEIKGEYLKIIMKLQLTEFSLKCQSFIETFLSAKHLLIDSLSSLALLDQLIRIPLMCILVGYQDDV